MKKQPNQFYVSVFFDSCAFDGGNKEEQIASNEARSLFSSNGNEIKIVYSVQKEIDFSNTPQWVKDEANKLVSTLEVQLTPNELKELNDVQRIIVGNGNFKKRKADCRHVFEAIKYGRYFITTDNGILNHSQKILSRFSTLLIIKPSEFLSIIKNLPETL